MPQREALNKADIQRLLEELNEELAAKRTKGEVYIVGGAVMCVAFNARESTGDVDAVFKPSSAVRAAAARVAARSGAPENWLNDAVKGWIGTRGTFDRWFERSNLKVFLAQAEYVLAMKSVAMRLGAEFHDLDDVRYLLRHLNITTSKNAISVVTRYFDAADIPPKTRFALEELLGG